MAERVLYGLVLAGGESRRMGADKALLMNAGESQLARAVRLLGARTERVFVSTRAEQAAEPERARFSQIVDRYEDIGPIAGVLSAMDEHPVADWLVVACDLPNLSDTTLAALIDACDDESPFVAFRSVHNDLPEPLCAIYAAGSRSLLDAFVADAIRCPRKMMIRSETKLLDPVQQDALDNINTPEDLAQSVLEVRT